MATPNLQPRHCFGFKPDVNNSLHWLEGPVIAYPVGHSIVIMDTEHRTQKFIPCSPEAARITALAVSPNLKHLAVAEAPPAASDQPPNIAIYDLATLKRRKTLASPEPNPGDIVDMHFSPDSRLLLSQGAAPEWMLSLWIWEKGKLGSSLRTGAASGAVLSARFCPNESGFISVLGTNFVKVLRSADNVLKAAPPPLAKREPQEYTCQAWVAEGDKQRLALGCASGEILLVDGLELKAVLHSEGSAPVDSIVAWSKGFLVGQANGALAAFERDEREAYRRTKVFTLREPAKFICLAVSAHEAQLALATATGQILTLAVGNLEIMKPEEDHFELLCGMDLPSAAVTGLDVCLRKPLAATCSLDRTVRIWNWQDSSLELAKTFQDEALSICIHPNGLLVLVGFADKLRMFTVLVDDLKQLREFPVKQCRALAFCNGGQFFAAANGSLLQIYSTYTCELAATMRGHSGKIASLSWSKDDSRIISAGKDGAVYEWRMSDGKREKEHVQKGCQYTAAVQTADNVTMVVAGSDCLLKELEEHANAGAQVKQELETGEVLTSVHLNKDGKLLVAATASGTLRVYKYPLTGEFTELRFHAGGVAAMRAFFDESLLFTAGDDGTVFVFDVQVDLKAGGVLRRDGDRLPFADEVMVTKSDLEDRKARYAELEAKYNEQLRQNQITIHIKDLETREKVKELTEKLALESESEHQRYEMLRQQKVEAELEFSERLKSDEERKQAQLAALDGQYQTKIMSEVERYQALAQEKEMLNQKWDEQNATLVEAHEKVVQEITEELEAKLLEEQTSFGSLTLERDNLVREFEEVKRQLEEDADREIESLKERYETKLAVERKLAVTLKGENGLMRKRFSGLEKAIEEQKGEIRRLHEAQDTLYTTIAAHEKDMQAFKEEIKDRDNTISEKEKRIYDLKKKNQELEKFKFVLDHKIKELKKQIEPKDDEIADMRDQIKEMDQELEKYHKSNAELELSVSDLHLKQASLKTEVLSQRSALGAKSGHLQCFQHDLHDAAQSLQDPKELKDKVRALYQRHINSGATASPLEDGIQEEYQRQRDYLEKTVQSLKHKLEKDTQLHRTDNLRIMQENVALIKEINELRREIKMLKVAAASGQGVASGGASAATERELEVQRDMIGKLREEIRAKEDRIGALEAQIMPRPMSRERLPPMDGFAGAHEVSAR